MALYQNGILISGANTLPQMTLAEYQTLPVSERPTYWERTDLNYNNIPASDVTYGSGSVEDALDELAPSAYQTTGISYIDCSRIDGGYFIVGKICFLQIRIEPTSGSSGTKKYVSLPMTPIAGLQLVPCLCENTSDDSDPIYCVISGNSIYLKGTTSNKGYSIFAVFPIQ